jgi:hypothetical protein
MIPFKILLRAIYDHNQKPTEMNKRILDILEQTCKSIISGNEEFRKNLIKQVLDFASAPDFRSVDVVPSILIFIAQLSCLLKIEKIEEQITLTKSQL